MDLLGNGFNLLLILLGFGFLIFFHELGHFLAAKWAGIRAEAFAVGMGSVVCSWRKGIGFTFGSTAGKVKALAGKVPEQLTDAELSEHNLGETEYSLRWLPIGGFVKMLGQDDTNPLAVSDEPRSYTSCPVGKRMVVVSAGVIMNLILAAVLFVIAFMVGVRFEAPVIGDALTTMPAGQTVAANADVLGISTPGILPGDRVVSINGNSVETFADVQIASAMARPEQTLTLKVERAGLEAPLEFQMIPEKSAMTGLLSIGVSPALSGTLLNEPDNTAFVEELRTTGLTRQGVEAGMTLTSIGGTPVSTLEQVNSLLAEADGRALAATWQRLGAEGQSSGESVVGTLPVTPTYQLLPYVTPPIAGQEFERGLLGLSPLAHIVKVNTSSANLGVLQPGDVILRVGTVHAPRFADVMAFIQKHEPGPVDMVVLRNGAPVELTAEVSRRGLFDSSGILDVILGHAFETPLVAKPMASVATRQSGKGDETSRKTSVAALDLLPGTRIISIAGMPISDWADMREALRSAVAGVDPASGVQVAMTVEHPELGGRAELALQVEPDDVTALGELQWVLGVSPSIFEPVYVTRSAEGNPIRAIMMGVDETRKTIIMTYLTLHRLFIGSVGVKQLRGPVGILDLGTRILPRGFMYFLFFLGMISVNLAVINFLPLPIVDGGLFLFLIYEKFKGRPPSVAFQNAAMIAGLFLIATAFLVVTWNDVARLIG